LSCPYTSGLIGGCCACDIQGAASSTATAIIMTTHFATTNLGRFNMVNPFDGIEIGTRGWYRGSHSRSMAGARSVVSQFDRLGWIQELLGKL
jgi:hypothetical protein